MKERFTRRELLRFAGLGSVVALLAACAPRVVKETVVVEKDVIKEAPKEKVKLVYQPRGAPTDEMWALMLELYHKQYPDVEVELGMGVQTAGGGVRQALTAQMVAGDAPDLYSLCCSDSGFFIQGGQALNLQPFIDRDAEEVNLADFYDHQFDPWTLEGDIYMMPTYTGSVVIWYNKTMFDEMGVAYPPTKWGEVKFEDYYQMALKFVKRDEPLRWGTTSYDHGANWITQYWLRGFGTHMVNPEDYTECLLCQPDALECLERLRVMIHEDHAWAMGAATGGIGNHALFGGQRTAMFEVGSWGLRLALEPAGALEGEEAEIFDFDVAPMWTGPGPKGTTTTHQSVDGISAYSGTDYPEEAWGFVKMVASPEYERYSLEQGTQPSRKSMLPEWIAATRELWPYTKKVNLEVFAESIYQSIGGPEEFFLHNDITCSTILKPAFDRVLLANEAPVELICKHAEVATKFNRGEIAIEDIGLVLSKIKV